MGEAKFAGIPSIIGTTTNELVENIPIYDGIGTNFAIFQLLNAIFPYVNANTLADLLFYYPIANFQNVGPPLAGSQWGRAVEIVNDLQIFCPSYAQAVEVSAVAPVWKCKS